MFGTLYGLTYTQENRFLSRPMRKPLLLVSPKVFYKTFYSHFYFICQIKVKQLEGTYYFKLLEYSDEILILNSHTELKVPTY